MKASPELSCTDEQEQTVIEPWRSSQKKYSVDRYPEGGWWSSTSSFIVDILDNKSAITFATRGKNGALQQKAVLSEMDSHRKNNTWKILQRVSAANSITYCWVLGLKDCRSRSG